MKRSEWYKREDYMLMNTELPTACKDYIQRLLGRALVLCGTIVEEDLKP